MHKCDNASTGRMNCSNQYDLNWTTNTLDKRSDHTTLGQQLELTWWAHTVALRYQRIAIVPVTNAHVGTSIRLLYSVSDLSSVSDLWLQLRLLSVATTSVVVTSIRDTVAASARPVAHW